MRGLKSYFIEFWTFLVATSGFLLRPEMWSRQGIFDVKTFSFLSLLYLSRDLSFTVSTSLSILLFPHSAFLVATSWISVATRKFLGLPKQSNSQQFHFIQIQSRQLQLNSFSLCKYSTTIHYASHSKFKYQNKIKFPQTFNHAISETKFK